MGFNKTRTQFLFLIGFVLFLTFILNLVPIYFQTENQVLAPPGFLLFNVRNQSQLTKSVTIKHSINIWKTVYGEDRIVEQLAFAPNVATDLSPKRILIQNGVEGWSVKHGKAQFVDSQCKVQNCELISRPVPGEMYDARMFKEIELNSYVLDSINRETPRHPDQVWIMFALESPEASPNYEGLNHVVNWTATYRHQSTINTPYDKWVPYERSSVVDVKVPKKNYAEGKTKLGAIFVSNCNAANSRLEYIKELKKYIDVDIYGYCGDKQCVKDSQNTCYEMLRKEYKFYFSFENANCKEYITEKFFLNALRHDVVPVVMGAHPDDYKRVAPTGSYIHVEDFSGPKALSQYLKKLAQDDEEYNKYFEWKDKGEFIDTKFWCRICALLWDPDRPKISVADLNQWWRRPGTCIGSKRWDGFEPERNMTT